MHLEFHQCPCGSVENRWLLMSLVSCSTCSKVSESWVVVAIRVSSGKGHDHTARCARARVLLRALRATDRPSDRGHMSHVYITLPRMRCVRVDIVAQTIRINVTRQLNRFAMVSTCPKQNSPRATLSHSVTRGQTPCQAPSPPGLTGAGLVVYHQGWYSEGPGFESR